MRGLRGWVLAGALAGGLAIGGCPSGGLQVRRGGEVTLRAFDVAWHKDLYETLRAPYRPRERSQPARDTRTGWMYVGDRLGRVHALDASGESQWVVRLPGSIDAGLLVQGERVLVATTGGAVFALDARTGESRWRYDGTAELATTPTLDGDLLLVPSLSNTLVALDVETGEFRWFHRHPQPADLTIRGAVGATVEGGRVFTAFSDGTVVALDRANGEVVWTRTFGARGDFVDIDTTPVVAGDRVLVAGYDGSLHALDAETGEEVWSVEAAETTIHLARIGDRVVLAATERAEARRITDGALAWGVELTGGVPTTPVVAGERIYIATTEGPLYVLDTRTGRPKRAFEPGPGIGAPPVITGDAVWVWSNGGSLYRLVRP